VRLRQIRVGEWQGRATRTKHFVPVPIVDVEVILNDPALRELEVPIVATLSADAVMMLAGLAPCFEDDHVASGLGPFEYGSTKSSDGPSVLRQSEFALFAARSVTRAELSAMVAQGVPASHRV